MSSVIVYDDGNKLNVSGADSTEEAVDNLKIMLNNPSPERTGSLLDDARYFIRVIRQSRLGGSDERLSLSQILFGAGRPKSAVWEDDKTSINPALNERYGSVFDDTGTVYHFDEAAFRKASNVLKYGAITLAVTGIAIGIAYKAFKK